VITVGSSSPRADIGGREREEQSLPEFELRAFAISLLATLTLKGG
jgi:hypothetical protein